MDSINIAEKFAQVPDYWHPYVIGDLNENYIKLAKLKGEFVWHQHDDEDELFIVYKGILIMDYRDRTITVNAGEIVVVPKGVEHRPRTNGEEVWVMLVEPRATLHTGNVITERTVTSIDSI